MDGGRKGTKREMVDGVERSYLKYSSLRSTNS